MSDPDPRRTVADADVLAADLFDVGASRPALELIRDHDWLRLVVTDRLVADAKSLIRTHADTGLATDWEARIRSSATTVKPIHDGHPALAAAAAGDAATVLSLDPTLRSVAAGTAIREAVTTSVKSPDAFTTLVDPARLYETLYNEPYPGPDR